MSVLPVTKFKKAIIKPVLRIKPSGLLINYHTTVCIFVLLCLQFLKAQNLIPDSSFENNKVIPIEFSAINASHAWNMPSQGTTDLFCRCGRKWKKESLVNVPQNAMGIQYAHSGICYAGLFAFSHGDYREYLQTPLSAPLEKNKNYRFTCYISLADYSRTAVDQIGICFLDKKVHYNFSDVITDLDPVYVNIDRTIGRDTGAWHRISTVYAAHGGETYLLLGSFELNKIKKTKFKAPKEVKSRIHQNSERDAYYFIDDVSLVETTDMPPAKKTDVVKTTEPELPKDTPLTLNHVLFQTNEAVLLPSSYAELDDVAEHLKKHPETQIEISGHTDNSGNERANQALSLARASAVAEYLMKKNIDKQRISSAGYGSMKPLVDNDTEAHKQQNRRVEFVLH